MDWIAKLDEAPDKAAKLAVLEKAREHLPRGERADLTRAYNKWLMAQPDDVKYVSGWREKSQRYLNGDEGALGAGPEHD